LNDRAGSAADKRRGKTPSAKPKSRGRKPRDMTWTVYSSLRESILNGALPPGESLSQVQLATKLGVSRGPLREAVRMLQREGLVEAEVNRRGAGSPTSGA
jgi:DNA-binding GntR family transcriptional regulator